jgi:hypothetical protein
VGYKIETNYIPNIPPFIDPSVLIDPKDGVDRYSAISKTGAADAFVDESKRDLGWKIALTEPEAFVQYDRVEFGKAPLKSVKVRANSATGATIEIRLDKNNGPVVAKVEIPMDAEWKEITANLANSPTDLHNLVVTLPERGNVEIDWVSFE